MSACNQMEDLISQPHMLGLIDNNLPPLCNFISNASTKTSIDLTKHAECIKVRMETGAFDVINKRMSKPHIAETMSVYKEKFHKDTKKNFAVPAKWVVQRNILVGHTTNIYS